MCDGDLQCVFDYAVTNNVSFAAATHMTTIGNQETQNILSEGSTMHKEYTTVCAFLILGRIIPDTI